MKHTLFASAVFIIGMQLQAVAQNNSCVNAFSYGIEDSTIYQVSNCVPGSEVAFYSEPDGGHCLRTSIADSRGVIIVSSKKGFEPAMAVNHSLGAIPGNNTSAPVGDKQFTLKDVAAETLEQQVRLNWKAASLAAPEYTFEVLKQSAGGVYVPVCAQPSHGEMLSSYTFTDVLQPGETVSYKLHVYNKAKTVEYTSHVFRVDNRNIKVYPTAVAKALNIAVSDVTKEWQYRIVNTAGMLVQAGKISQANTSLSLDELSPGNYFITVIATGSEAAPAVFKFSKL